MVGTIQVQRVKPVHDERITRSLKAEFKERLEHIKHTNNMMFIPSGFFKMGKEGSRYAPLHEVALDAYFMSMHTATNAEFAAFVEETKYKTTSERQKLELNWKTFSQKEREKHPVVCVSFIDVKAYALWKSQNLPTEAQWEYAARGGLVGKLYSHGDEAAEAICGIFGEKIGTVSVSEGVPNGFGLFHMAGNVWEICSDFYDSEYYAKSPRVNPQGPEVGELIVRRGGAYNVAEMFRLECANRGTFRLDQSEMNTGFRTVQNIDFNDRSGAAIFAATLPMIADGGGAEIINTDNVKKQIVLRMRGTCDYCPNILASAESLITRIEVNLFDMLEIIILSQSSEILAKKQYGV